MGEEVIFIKFKILHQITTQHMWAIESSSLLCKDVAHMQNNVKSLHHLLSLQREIMIHVLYHVLKTGIQCQVEPEHCCLFACCTGLGHSTWYCPRIRTCTSTHIFFSHSQISNLISLITQDLGQLGRWSFILVQSFNPVANYVKSLKCYLSFSKNTNCSKL
jgi:hypothetical protein